MSSSTVTRSLARSTRSTRSPGRTRAAGTTRAARPAPRAGAVRLTRRGRVVLTLLLLAVVLAAFLVFSGRSVASDEAGAPVATRTVVVGEGDTLWAIAASVAEPGTDLREVVHDLEQLNSLSGPALEVGQEIAVPRG